jgi:hypothetical protein
MKISYSAVWADAMNLLRAHGSLVATVAGVFILLPWLLVAYFLPPPETSDPARVIEAMTEYYSANWPWLLLNNLVAMAGAGAVLMLVFRPGITVGGAIVAAAAILPFYFLASVLSSLIMMAGLLLLIVPGLYLFGRLATVTTIVVAEERRNPVDAVRRSFALTKGNGWAVLGLILLVAIAAVVLTSVVTWVVGILFVLVAGQDLAATLVLILRAAANAGTVCLLLLLIAAIYRQLAGSGSPPVKTAD